MRFNLRLAIISDIHGNLEAFKQVLADIDASSVDGVACLGDNIGYGPDPEEVVRIIRQRDIPCVMGNHELAVVDSQCLRMMNPSARTSLCLTKKLISRDTVRYITGLKPSMAFHGSLCVHGCPPDSVTTYLFQVTGPRLRQIFMAMKSKMCFVGHTHDLNIISFDGREITWDCLGQGVVALRKDRQYVVNVGSVGQPRDGNNHAKYVIWDTASGTIEVKFIPYDIGATASKILALGFPEFNAKRLW
jgi:predicted phosphodiesterase